MGMARYRLQTMALWVIVALSAGFIVLWMFGAGPSVRRASDGRAMRDDDDAVSGEPPEPIGASDMRYPEIDLPDTDRTKQPLR